MKSWQELRDLILPKMYDFFLTGIFLCGGMLGISLAAVIPILLLKQTTILVCK